MRKLSSELNHVELSFGQRDQRKYLYIDEISTQKNIRRLLNRIAIGIDDKRAWQMGKELLP